MLQPFFMLQVGGRYPFSLSVLRSSLHFPIQFLPSLYLQPDVIVDPVVVGVHTIA